MTGLFLSLLLPFLKTQLVCHCGRWQQWELPSQAPTLQDKHSVTGLFYFYHLLPFLKTRLVCHRVDGGSNGKIDK
jgi:hypothetical protein